MEHRLEPPAGTFTGWVLRDTCRGASCRLAALPQRVRHTNRTTSDVSLVGRRACVGQWFWQGAGGFW